MQEDDGKWDGPAVGAAIEHAKSIRQKREAEETHRENRLDASSNKAAQKARTQSSPLVLTWLRSSICRSIIPVVYIA